MGIIFNNIEFELECDNCGANHIYEFDDDDAQFSMISAELDIEHLIDSEYTADKNSGRWICPRCRGE